MASMNLETDKKRLKMQKACKGCVYMGTSVRSCDYILVEKHKRPCPPGDICTVKVIGRKKRAKEFTDDLYVKGEK